MSKGMGDYTLRITFADGSNQDIGFSDEQELQAFIDGFMRGYSQESGSVARLDIVTEHVEEVPLAEGAGGNAHE